MQAVWDGVVGFDDRGSIGRGAIDPNLMERKSYFYGRGQ